MEDLIKYFTNLLILQYRNKPKAKATIEALVKILFSNTTDGIFAFDIENAYDLENASQKQLDVLGKYIGYTSKVNIIVDNTFKYAEYDDSVNPDTGYSEYDDSVTSYPYAEYRYTTYLERVLNYDDYTKVLGFLAECKNSVLSLGEIDRLLEKHFDGDIFVVEGDKEIEYHFVQEFLAEFEDATQLQVFVDKYMPKPMGCSAVAVREPYYINAIPHGGAEDYVTGLVFSRDSSDYNMFFETPMKFDFKPNEYPIFHTLKVKARIKVFDTESIFSCGYWTTLNGTTYTNDNMGDLSLIKATTVFSMMTNKTTRRDITSVISSYDDKWVDITLELNHEKYGTYTIWAIVECEGVATQTVNTMWSTPDWNQFPILWGVGRSVSLYPVGLKGAIDFKGCSIEMDGEVKWKGYTNKRLQGV